jgi:hypothetical protein
MYATDDLPESLFEPDPMWNEEENWAMCPHLFLNTGQICDGSGLSPLALVRDEELQETKGESCYKDKVVPRF